jgi:hypothetical protein
MVQKGFAQKRQVNLARRRQRESGPQMQPVRTFRQRQGAAQVIFQGGCDGGGCLDDQMDRVAMIGVRQGEDDGFSHLRESKGLVNQPFCPKRKPVT